MPIDLDKVKRWIQEGRYLIAYHAKVRMVERQVSTPEMERIIESGDVIEEYPDDDPCSSLLMLGYVKKKPIHMVVGICEDHLRIITVYVPSKDKWIEDRTRRN